MKLDFLLDELEWELEKLHEMDHKIDKELWVMVFRPKLHQAKENLLERIENDKHK